MTRADAKASGTTRVHAEGRRADVEASASSDAQMAQQEKEACRNENESAGVKDDSIPPQWVSDFLDAASSGGNEFRKEARKLIKEGYGAAVQALLEDMEKKAPEDSKEGIEKMVKCVKAWVEDPSTLEEGGRWWSYWDSGLFSNSWFGYYQPNTSSWGWLPSSNQGGAQRPGQAGKTTKYTSTW